MPAPALRDLQASFWRSLHTGDADPALVAVVPAAPTLAPADRVAIYQSMYVWRLVEVLREDFPKTAEVLGDAFADVVRDYLARHPSEHPSVRHLGRHVATFLTTHATAAQRPWLADLARLERARVDAFDAPDAVPVRVADLAAIAPDAWADLRFEPIPALDVVRSAFAVHEAWAAPTGRPARRDTVLRVWRQDFAVFHAAVDAVDDTAFAALRDGATFAGVCEVVAERVSADAAPAEAGALLARWIENGLVARLR